MTPAQYGDVGIQTELAAFQTFMADSLNAGAFVFSCGLTAIDSENLQMRLDAALPA